MNHHKPLAGRRLYFVGIGGSGMSAYANIARALGAEVRGWDLRETIFMGSLEGIEVDLGGEPAPPDGWEVVVSTAHLHRIEGMPRADFLAELVAAQPAIVVGGAHGKTTTAAMIAFVLQETGHDPAWIIGGIVPQLGGNAGVGDGWLVVEGDESDRSIGSLAPADRRGHEHRARPPRGRTRPRPSCAPSSTTGSPRCRTSSASWELPARRARARRARRAQPPERGRGARGARAGRRRRAPRRRRRSRASRASADGSSSSASAAASRSTTTTATTRPSSR